MRQNGGQTIYQWARKVKTGDVIAGDDYYSDWPLVMLAVDAFIRDTGFELYVTERTEEQSYCQYPTWAAIKTEPVTASPPQALVRQSLRRAY